MGDLGPSPRASSSQAPAAPSAPATGPLPIQRGTALRTRKTRYPRVPYRHSSKFRFIRWRRRSLQGYTSKAKAGINLFTVKYKKGNRAYYLTTRSVPSTNAGSFKLPTGHSEDRYQFLKTKFEKRHKLKPSHFQWGATEREPCGQGAGMANCRSTLSSMGIPDNKIFFGHEYPGREDVRKKKSESSSELNERASTLRKKHNTAMETDVKWLSSDYDSDTDSEDEDDVVDEYESDYEENMQPRRKRKVKKLSGAFRGGFEEF